MLVSGRQQSRTDGSKREGHQTHLSEQIKHVVTVQVSPSLANQRQFQNGKRYLKDCFFPLIAADLCGSAMTTAQLEHSAPETAD